LQSTQPNVQWALAILCSEVKRFWRDSKSLPHVMSVLTIQQCTDNVTLWRFHLIIVAVETQQCIFCVVQLHATVSCIKILTVAQPCLYGKFISLAAVKLTQVFM
jgi:hypothetical protein